VSFKFKVSYLIIPVITVLVATIGSFITAIGMVWYNGLNFPAFVPRQLYWPGVDSDFCALYDFSFTVL